jgi:hypothetical protein
MKFVTFEKAQHGELPFWRQRPRCLQHMQNDTLLILLDSVSWSHHRDRANQFTSFHDWGTDARYTRIDF